MEVKDRYAHLRNKSPQHIERLRIGLRGNKNAVKSGEFTRAEGYLCNTCIVADRCPKFQKDSVCGFKKWGYVETRDYQEAETAMKESLRLNAERILRGLWFENLNGGKPDPEVSKMLVHRFYKLKELAELMNEKKRSEKYVVLDRDSPLGKIFGTGIAVRKPPPNPSAINKEEVNPTPSLDPTEDSEGSPESQNVPAQAEGNPQ